MNAAESDAPPCLRDHIAAGGNGADTGPSHSAEVRKASLCGKEAITLTPVAFSRSRPVPVRLPVAELPFETTIADLSDPRLNVRPLGPHLPVQRFASRSASHCGARLMSGNRI
jgi:hypothetical protein